MLCMELVEILCASTEERMIAHMLHIGTLYATMYNVAKICFLTCCLLQCTKISQEITAPLWQVIGWV